MSRALNVAGAAKNVEYAVAVEEVTEWDEYGQGYKDGECIVCICGTPYPMRKSHYCPYDPPVEWYEAPAGQVEP